MPKQVHETAVPPNSKITALIPNCSFYDAWAIESADLASSALEQFIKTARKTPSWVEACMNLRNQVGQLVGLKNLGGLSGLSDKPSADYQQGDRVGIFTLFENSFDEVLLGDHDKHLDVTLSVHRSLINSGQQVRITLTTVVHTHNFLGKLYMLPVKPMHRIIAPTVLAKLS
ncbi:DUF2867 domain-containing protein [uncultured Thiothrix sp.]|uniref:DUF2867 domain-containing protein n=1 Tax=uncultured Thiothrix sp. TaxID=223185 RepID=UPI002625858B|nr:DUF2867 domain-containing protein [uncultured Thiothrix sp.]